MKFKVSVEKRLYVTGTVIVDCDDADTAVDMVANQIMRDELQTTDIKDWGDPQYEDCPFSTTGDVDEV